MHAVGAQAASQLEARLATHDAPATLAGTASGQGIDVGLPAEDALEAGAPPETVDPQELRDLATGMRQLLDLKDAGNRCTPVPSWPQ